MIMKYIKKIFLLAVIFTLNTLFAQTKNIGEDEKIQLAMLMNQIQYTTSNIIQNKDREILNQEFDFIINQIDKSKLYDYTIKSSYIDLLDTIKQLKLTENEKKFVIEMNTQERKQAYTKAFSSFGSVFNGGFSPISLVTSLAYTGISAGLNITSAKYDANNKLKEQLFKLDQKELNLIDDSRINLFSAYSDIITSYKIPSKYEISETEMKDFIKQLAEKKDNHKDLIRILENKKHIFEYFPVFWYQLGAQYQLNSNFSKAIECYNKYELLKKNYSYLKTDPYYICVAKNMIQILLEKNTNANIPLIINYLKIIENNIVPENESENRIFLAGIYFKLGQNEKAKSLLKLNLARREFYSIASDMLALIEYEENSKSNTLNPALLFELNAIDMHINIEKDKNLTVLIPAKFALDKFVYIIVNNKIYQTPLPPESDSKNCKISYKIDLEQKGIYELILGIINKNNQIIELKYDCSFIKNNSKVIQLLSDVQVTPNEIESCLLPDLYKQLDNFSYDAKKDTEYTSLLENHKKQISKQTSTEQKKVFEKEEKEKLDTLKISGRLKAITDEITNSTKELPNKPYFCSKLSINNKKDMFCYSLKEAKYFSDFYKFEQFGIVTKNPIEKTIYAPEVNNLLKLASTSDNVAQYELFKCFLTGNNVERDVFSSYKMLVLAAMNNNVIAQYELATLYDNGNSKLFKYFSDAGIIISDIGIIPFIKSEKEYISSYWYKKSADNGNAQATLEIAKRYESGIGVEKNIDLAKEYYSKAFYSYGMLDAEKKVSQ